MSISSGEYVCPFFVVIIVIIEIQIHHAVIFSVLRYYSVITVTITVNENPGSNDNENEKR